MYEIFEQLLLQRGITAYRVAKETGVTTATLTNWKNGKYTPKQDKLQKIADYFGVSLEYLMNGNEKYKTPESVAAIERNISGKEGFRAILADIYDRCEDTEVFGEYGSSFYFSIGSGKSRYAIEEADFDRLYYSAKTIIKQMTDLVKKDELVVRHECENIVNETPSLEKYTTMRKLGVYVPELEARYGFNTLEPVQLLNAAHERTDIEPTEEMKQNDNDIMNDPDF